MEATEAAIADTFKALEARLGGAADRLQPAASKKITQDPSVLKTRGDRHPFAMESI